jgi:hypothetical protein
MKVFTGVKKLAIAIYNGESAGLLYLDPEDVEDSPNMATLADLDLQSYRYELRGERLVPDFVEEFIKDENCWKDLVDEELKEWWRLEMVDVGE